MQDLEADEIRVSQDDGSSLRVLAYGDADAPGPPLLFLAGWLSIPRNWDEVLGELRGRHRIWYCESREKSSSIIPQDRRPDFSVPRMVRDLQTLVTELVGDEQPYMLAGSSLGGTVILEYLAAGGRPPERCALIAPNSEYRFPGWLRLLLPLIPVAIWPLFRHYIKFHLRHFRLDPEREPEQYAKYCETVDLADPRKLKPNALALMDYRLSAGIEAIQTPCLVLGGQADRLHGLDELRGLCRALPNAALLSMASNRATHSASAGKAMARFFERGFDALAEELDQSQ